MSEVPMATHQEQQNPAIPEELPLLPLLDHVVFPQTMIPLAVGQPPSVKLIDDVMVGDRMAGLVALRHPTERPAQPRPEDFYTVGTVAAVHKLVKMPDGTLRVAVQG